MEACSYGCLKRVTPPMQSPAPPQSRTFWTESSVEGQAPLRLMFQRSDREEVAAIAQQDPLHQSDLH